MSRRLRGRSVISGELLYDGAPPTMKKIKSETAYVQQQVCTLTSYPPQLTLALRDAPLPPTVAATNIKAGAKGGVILSLYAFFSCEHGAPQASTAGTSKGRWVRPPPFTGVCCGGLRGRHTTAQVQRQVQGGLLLDVVVHSLTGGGGECGRRGARHAPP
jgi:hypothetical protein